MIKLKDLKKYFSFIIIPIFIIIGLILISKYSFLLFHSIAELFSAVVAFGIFIIAWNSRHYLGNNYLHFLGIGFFFIGSIDLVHTLAYKGMGVFNTNGANLPTQLWITARYLESFSFLIAPMLFGRKLRNGIVTISYFIVTALLLLLIFKWQLFPDCFIEGRGLTPFKKISEYIISFILFISIILLKQHRNAFDRYIYRLLFFSIIITIGAELAFTLYISVYGISNFVGHILKVISFYLIYMAIIKKGLSQPFSLLFRNLKENEEELRTSDERFSRIFHADPNSLAVTNLNDEKYIEVNKGFTQTTGFTSEEAIGNTPIGLGLAVDTSYRKRISKELKYVGRFDNIEILYRHKKGELRNGLIFGEIFEVGNKKYLLTVLIDISKRKKAEEALKASEAKWRSLTQNLPDNIMTLDLEGNILFTNHTISEQDKKTVMGKPIFDFVAKNHISIIKECFERVKISGKQDEYEVQYFTKEGEEVILESRVAPIKDSGKVVAFTVSSRDVTVNRRLEAQLQQTHQMEAIATLSGGIAHEFNNALAVVAGNVDLLCILLSEEKRIESQTKLIKKAIYRMASLSDQLLAYSGEGKYQEKNISLSQFIEDTLPIVRHSIDSSIHIDLDLAMDIPYVKADGTQLRMLLSAILKNSSEALNGNGIISITTKAGVINDELVKNHPNISPGPCVYLEIIDNGMGMDKETKEKIFEPFFSTKFQGRGLGMAAVFGIVKNHNAAISIESDLGKGTKTRIWFPINEDIGKNINKKTTKNKKVGEEMTQATILVIDDEKAVLETNRNLLETLGYSVLSASTGKEAIDIVNANENHIDVAILDLILPDMAGKTIFTSLRDKIPDLKVILCSGYTIDGPAQEIMDLGAKIFMQKPFSIKKLHSNIIELLDN